MGFLLRDEIIIPRYHPDCGLCNRHSPESNNPCPYNGELPYVPTICSYETNVQNIGSGVYLHIRRHLLAPTAVSLKNPSFPPNMSGKDIFLSFAALYYKTA